MDIRQSIYKILSNSGGLLGTSAVAVVASDPYRLAIQINNCMATGMDAEIYVGYDSSVSATRHIARILPGGPPVELSVRSTVPLYMVASQANTRYALAEVC